MTPKPDTAAAQTQEDAVKLLRLLAEKCPKPANEHDWHDCPRCLVFFDLESRQPFALKLLNAAIAALDAAPSQPTAREEGASNVTRCWVGLDATTQEPSR